MNASTFTARVITSTGADVAAAFSGAIGAMSGPLHGGAPVARARHDRGGREVAATRDAYVKELLDSRRAADGLRPPRLPRRGPAGAGAAAYGDASSDAPRYEVAEALEKAALAELRERRPDRVLETNVEFWAAIVLDFAEVPAHMFTSMFTCARTGGWSAHILEQKTTGRLIRPSAIYAGPAPRPATDVDGWRAEWAAVAEPADYFAGKSAIVTGAGSGIGAALSRALVVGGRARGLRRPRPVRGREDGRVRDRARHGAGGRPRRHRRRRRRRRWSTSVPPSRDAGPDVQQRRHQHRRRDRGADARPLERDHRRQHPRRGARRRSGVPGDGRASGQRPHRQHRLDGRADGGRPDHVVRHDEARRRRALAGAALGGRRAKGSASPWSARRRSTPRSSTRARSGRFHGRDYFLKGQGVRRPLDPDVLAAQVLERRRRQQGRCSSRRGPRGSPGGSAGSSPSFVARSSIRFVAKQRKLQDKRAARTS